jgi:hypothetical protein
LFCLELIVGAPAVYGGVMLVTDAWRLPLDYLDPLPLHSWVLPGIAFAGRGDRADAAFGAAIGGLGWWWRTRRRDVRHSPAESKDLTRSAVPDRRWR